MTGRELIRDRGDPTEPASEVAPTMDEMDPAEIGAGRRSTVIWECESLGSSSSSPMVLDEWSISNDDPFDMSESVDSVAALKLMRGR